MICEIMQRIRDIIVVLFLALCSKAVSGGREWRAAAADGGDGPYCQSWRVAVEANNVRAWRTVPTQCLRHIESYMTGGQYERDVNFTVDAIFSFVDNEVSIFGDGLDAWILDVDDTCISNLIYYQTKRFGCDPYDPAGFKAWATKGECPAIPSVLRLFKKLVKSGFKVFLLTGRSEDAYERATIKNLRNQGFIGYERLILRTGANKELSAVAYKSKIRKQLVKEGYKIWGNVGDQWSDLQGDHVGNRTFKLPNPMYFVP
nr:acid phosphatase 1 [Ipomoea trifida]